MLMPIVSMNKMAMNESVATTCCYREVATPTAVYWEVLNGGWIGKGYVDGWKLKSDYASMNSSWRNLAYDINIAGGQVKTYLNTYRVQYLDATAGGVAGWYVYPTGDPNNSRSLARWLVDTGYTEITSSTCTHKRGSGCVYYESGIELVEDYHFESKTAHDKGGSDWKLPHKAAAFSS